MDITISVAFPAGNTTILVQTPIPQSDCADVANRLLALPSVHAEQVGFLVPPRMGGAVRLEMMGGEFCGNALRSAALWYICEHALPGKQTVLTEISGTREPLPVDYDPATGIVTARMPLPESVGECEIAGVRLPAVCFEGIVHVIANRPANWLTDDETRAALREVAAHYNKGAAGLLFVDPEKDTMRPAVYVAGTDTLTRENSCASGTAAVAAFAFGDKAEGEHTLTLHQPGGSLTATATVAGGHLTGLTLGGTVSLTDDILAII